MLGYLSLDIICSSNLTVFRRATLSENVSLLRTVMSADKYSSIFWCQMEAIVYISMCIRFFSFSFSASDDCEECGNYVRHIFSIVPGSLAIISLLIVLLFQHSHTTWRKSGKTVLNLLMTICYTHCNYLWNS